MYSAVLGCTGPLKLKVLIYVRAKVVNDIIVTISFMGNNGTFTKPWYQILIDFEFVYHMGYLVVSLLGLCVHEFFYSLLVS